MAGTEVNDFLVHLGAKDPVEADTEDFLEHYGIKGMKWGQRKSPAGLESVPKKTSRAAAKDAQEFARAKMFFGDGAGTRRKLIKAKVEANSKKDPNYKKAFDHHMANQDLGKHADKARKERRRKDVAGGTAKTARGVHRSLTGGMGNVTLLSAGIAAGAVAARKSGADQMIFNAAKTQVKNAQAKKNSGKAVNDWLKNNGFQ